MKQRIRRSLAIVLTVLVAGTSTNFNALTARAADVTGTTSVSEVETQTTAKQSIATVPTGTTNQTTNQTTAIAQQPAETLASGAAAGETSAAQMTGDADETQAAETQTAKLTEDIKNYIPASAEGFAGGYELTAYKAEDEDALNTIHAMMEAQQHQVIDCIEIDGSGTPADTETGVTVSLSEYTLEDPDNTGLYHIKDFDTDHASIEKLDYEYDAENRTVTFATRSFSPFVFATKTEQEKQAETESAAADETSEQAAAESEAAESTEAVTEPETDPVTEPADETETETESQAESEIATEPATETESETETAAETGAETETETAAETEIETAAETGTEKSQTETQTQTAEPSVPLPRREQAATEKVTAKLVWDDENNTGNGRPTAVTLHLLQDGAAYTDEAGKEVTATVSESTDWAAVFDNLPSGHEYTVTEDLKSNYGYTSTTSSTTSGSETDYTITNKVEFKDYDLTIKWNDYNDIYHKRPDSLAVKVGRFSYVVNGNSDDDTWKVTVRIPSTGERVYFQTDLSKSNISDYYSYATSSSFYTGKDPDNSLYLNVNASAINLYVHYNWEDSNNAYATRPSSGYGFVVKYKGEEAEPLVPGDLEFTYTPWTHDYRVIRMRKYDENGNAINSSDYTIEQKNVPSYYSSTPDVVSGGGTFTNTLETTTFTANIEWVDNTGEGITKPDSIYLTLYANGKELRGPSGKIISVAVASDQTSYSWTDLPKFDENGNRINYTVKEEPLSIFATSYDDAQYDETTNTTTQTITNTLTNKWEYAVDLHWHTSYADEMYHINNETLDAEENKLTYDLSISTNEASFPAGAIKVRLKYYLWQDDKGNWVAPSVPVPMASEQPDPDYSYVYTIDTKGTEDKSDDEIVFTNWEEVKAASNTIIPVTYTYYTRKTSDLSTASFQAVMTAEGASEGLGPVKSPEITIRVDTGLDIDSVTKTAELLYDPSAYYFIKGMTFDPDYNYVMWKVNIRGDANQDHQLKITDIPDVGDQGEIVAFGQGNLGFTGSDYNGEPVTLLVEGKKIEPTYDSFGDIKGYYFPESVKITQPIEITTPVYRENTMAFTQRGRGCLGNGFNGYYNSGVRYYLLMRYPRDNATQIGEAILATYHNKVNVTAETADGNRSTENTFDHEPDEIGDKFETDTGSAQASADWVDYVYRPTGYIYTFIKKRFGGYSRLEKSGLTILEGGQDATLDIGLYNSINGTYFGDPDDESYKYGGAVWDKDLYWNITGQENTGDYIRMTVDDYCATNVTVEIRMYDYNRRNGAQEPVEGINDLKFVVEGYNSKTGNWKEVGEFQTTTNNYSKGYNYAHKTFTIDDENITGFRVRYPDGMKGYVDTQISGNIKIKASSPQLKTWLAENPDLQKVYVMNIGSCRITKNDGSGTYQWFNPASENQNPQAETVGLTEEDIQQYGGRVEHSTRYTSLGRVEFSSIAGKLCKLNSENDQNYITEDFLIGAAEQVSSRKMGNEYYESNAIGEGTFYDLLPLGWTYIPDSCKAYGTEHGEDYKNGEFAGRMDVENAEVVSVETVNNYKNSGRQMVIFHVKAESGKDNYGIDLYQPTYDGYDNGTYMPDADEGCVISGFSLTYNAKISRKEYGLYGKGYNDFNFYKGLDAQGGSFHRGAGHNDGDKLDQIFKKDRSITVDGENVLKDANENGDVDSNEAISYYGVVEPKVPIPTQTGLTKAVLADGGTFVSEDGTHPDGQYTYRMNYSAADGEVKNLVIYDILEDGEYVENDGVRSLVTGEWKGTFDSVRVTLPEDVNAKPVIWYSVDTNLNYNVMYDNVNNEDVSQRQDISNTTIWTTEEPEDKSSITAIAVDLRYDADGNEYVFEEDSGASVYITMNSPAEMPEVYADDGNEKSVVFTYNTPAYNANFKPQGSSDFNAEETLTIGEAVQTYIQDCETQIKAKKELKDSDQNALSLKGGEFSFVLKDVLGREIETVTNDENGDIVFSPLNFIRTDVGTHTYTISEVIPDDAKSYVTYDKTPQTVTITVSEADDGTYTLTAETDKKAEDLVFSNTDSSKGSYTPVGTKEIISAETQSHDGLNRELKKGEFTFTVTEGDTVVSTGSNETDGSITFTPITYNRDDIGTHTYTITEDIPSDAENGTKDHITYTQESYTLTVTVGEPDENGSLSVTAAYTDEDGNAVTEPTFSNTYEASGKYAPTAFKILSGKKLEAGAFTFVVEDADNNNEVLLTGTNEAAEADQPAAIVFNDGDGDGEADTIPYTLADLGDHHYVIREVIPEDCTKVTDANGNVTYVKDYITYSTGQFPITVTVSDNGDGTLKAARTDTNTAALSFVNVNEAIGSVQPTAEKTLTGRDLKEGEFNFTITEGEGESAKTVSTGTNDADGTVTFTPIVYTRADAPDENETVTKIYTVQETNSGEDGITYSDVSYTMTVTLSKNEDGETEISTAYTNDKDGSAAETPVFENAYTAEGTAELTASKTLTGRELKTGEFTFVAADEDGNEIVATNDADGNVNFPAIHYTLEDAGKTHTYTVSERNDGEAGVTYDDTVYTVEVSVSDNNDGTLTVAPTITLNGETVDEMQFSNTFTPVETEIRVTKNLTGRSWQDGDSFTFELTAPDGTPMPDESELTIDSTTADKTGSFGTITYGETGTYTYSINEMAGDEKGIVYDEKAHKVTVTVARDEDTNLMTASVDYGEDQSGSLTITNTYKAEGSAQISARKVLEGRSLKDQEFSFTLKDEEGREITTAKNGADGTVKFDTIRYTLGDVGKHTYTITEKAGDDKTVVYDTTEYSAVVDVSDNADGTLKAEVTYLKDSVPTDEAVFVNSTVPETEKETETATETTTKPAPETDETTGTPATKNTTEVDTGDRSGLGRWAVIMVIAAAAVVVMLVLERRKRNTDEEE